MESCWNLVGYELLKVAGFPPLNWDGRNVARQKSARGDGDGHRRRFLGFLTFGMVSFALPLYALHLGLSLSEIGILISIRTVITLGLKPVAGWASDRVGVRAYTSPGPSRGCSRRRLSSSPTAC